MHIIPAHILCTHNHQSHTERVVEKERETLEITFFLTLFRFHTPSPIFDHFTWWAGATRYTNLVTRWMKVLTSYIARRTFRIVDLTLDWAYCCEETIKFM